MRKLIGLVVSALLLALLYAFVDVGSIWRAARAADPLWLAAGIAFVIPLTLMTSWRLTLITAGYHLGFGEANRLILAASTLNIFLPSKLGDLAKGQVLASRHQMRPSLALAVVVLEKALDMMSLLVWGTFGLIVVGASRPAMLLFLFPVAGGCILLALLVSPFRILPAILVRIARFMPARVSKPLDAFAVSWQEAVAWFWRAPSAAIGIIALSILIWAAHLFQFWLFSTALQGDVPLLENAAFATLCILAGLLPLTFAGIGTRDAAIVFFYAPYLGPGQAALLGILATLRYILPGIGGVPFVSDFAGLTSRPMRSSDSGAEPASGRRQ